MPREGVLVHHPYIRMNDDQVTQIHQASMEILRDPGLLSYNREAVEIFHSCGAEVTTVDSGDHPCWHIKIPEKLVLQALDQPAFVVPKARVPEVCAQTKTHTDDQQRPRQSPTKRGMWGVGCGW